MISYWIFFGMLLNGLHEVLISLVQGFDIWDVSGFLATFLRNYTISRYNRVCFNLFIIYSIIFHIFETQWKGRCLNTTEKQSSLLSFLQKILTLFKLIINIFCTWVLFLNDVVFLVDFIYWALMSISNLIIFFNQWCMTAIPALISITSEWWWTDSSSLVISSMKNVVVLVSFSQACEATLDGWGSRREYFLRNTLAQISSSVWLIFKVILNIHFTTDSKTTANTTNSRNSFRSNLGMPSRWSSHSKLVLDAFHSFILKFFVIWISYLFISALLLNHIAWFLDFEVSKSVISSII